MIHSELVDCRFDSSLIVETFFSLSFCQVFLMHLKHFYPLAHHISAFKQVIELYFHRIRKKPVS